MRPVARRPPRLRGRRKKRNTGDPLAHSRKQGPILFCALVGWAKALARNFPTARTLVRRAHAVINRNCARPREHGARETLVYGTTLPTPLPTLRVRHPRQRRRRAFGKTKPGSRVVSALVRV